MLHRCRDQIIDLALTALPTFAVIGGVVDLPEIVQFTPYYSDQLYLFSSIEGLVKFRNSNAKCQSNTKDSPNPCGLHVDPVNFDLVIKRRSIMKSLESIRR